MLLPLSWLKEFVPYEGDASSLGAKLTMLGLELDGIQEPFAGLKELVTGHVVQCEKHPEADKLSVCKVDVGTEILDIVCGAPNVRAGLNVAVIKVGSSLPNGLKIKATKLRGAPSNGMICSEFELGLSDEHDGIMELEGSPLPGTSLVDFLQLEKEVLDISVTPNRGDCLSILGLAREVALAYALPLRLPQLNMVESAQKASDYARIETIHDELCPMYSFRVIENAQSKASPTWMRFRLLSAGVRPISNIVDVTNYILMELGQPLHAFDLDCLHDSCIRVEMAKQGEKFIALNGQEYTLSPDDICIKDSQKVIALGGIMGGENTEISENTKRILLECASFHPSNIRRTARRLALHSESSHRFERGVDIGLAEYSINRAAELIAQLSGAQVLQGVVKKEAKRKELPSILLRHDRVTKLIGIPFSEEFCEKTLRDIGCTIQSKEGEKGAAQWHITPPSYRPHLTREADVITELVRVYGIEKIPAELPAITKNSQNIEQHISMHKFIRRIKNWGSGLGLNEVINYSFCNEKDLDLVDENKEHRVQIINPLSDEMNILRTVLAPGLFKNMETNLSHGAHSIKLFEVATCFYKDPSQETKTSERTKLAILCTGKRFEGAWPQNQEDFDYYDIKGIISNLIQSLHLGEVSFTKNTAVRWLSPSISVELNGKELGLLGKLTANLADNYLAKKDVWYAEIDLENLYQVFAQNKIIAKALPIYPAIKRDITCQCAATIESKSLIETVEALKIDLLESVAIIDVYQPQNTEQKNITLRLTFRHKDKTLKDKEVDKLRDAITSELQKSLQISI